MWTKKYFYYFQGLRVLKCHRTKRSNRLNYRSKWPLPVICCQIYFNISELHAVKQNKVLKPACHIANWIKSLLLLQQHIGENFLTSQNAGTIMNNLQQLGENFTLRITLCEYHLFYYSTNCNTIQIWSWCSRYLSSVGNRYPAIYIASYVLNVTTVPFEIKFTRHFLLQGFKPWSNGLASSPTWVQVELA